MEQHPSYKSLASRTKSKDVVFLATLFLQIYLSVSDGDREKKKSVSVVVRSTGNVSLCQRALVGQTHIRSVSSRCNKSLDFNGKVDYKLPSKKERAQFENYVWGAFDFYHFMDAAKRIKVSNFQQNVGRVKRFIVQKSFIAWLAKVSASEEGAVHSYFTAELRHYLQWQNACSSTPIRIKVFY